MNAAVFIGLALAATIAALMLMHPLATAQKTAADICMDAETRDKTRVLMFEGLNTALVHQTEKLFDNLLKERGYQPDRMTRGLEGTMKLYLRARENLLRWNPPPCKE